jgi:hypothetical protein
MWCDPRDWPPPKANGFYSCGVGGRACGDGLEALPDEIQDAANAAERLSGYGTASRLITDYLKTF